MKILQVVGYKNAGKTTLACELVRHFAQRGWRVGTIKHDAHDFEPDVPGKDTWHHRQAGAYTTAIASPTRTAWSVEQTTGLDALIAAMNGQAVDLVVVEGFKTAPHAKIVLLRGADDADLLRLPGIVAAAERPPAAGSAESAAVVGLADMPSQLATGLTDISLQPATDLADMPSQPPASLTEQAAALGIPLYQTGSYNWSALLSYIDVWTAASDPEVSE